MMSAFSWIVFAFLLLAFGGLMREGVQWWRARRARTSLATPDAPKTLGELQRRRAEVERINAEELRQRTNRARNYGT